MDEKIKKLAKKAGFILWKDESYKPEGQVIDWSSDYDQDLIRFYNLAIEDYKKSINKKGKAAPTP